MRFRHGPIQTERVPDRVRNLLPSGLTAGGVDDEAWHVPVQESVLPGEVFTFGFDLRECGHVRGAPTG
jgi:hypothetical protein